MSTTIDQKAYLQRYLGGPSGDKKKKKKKKSSKGKGFKIIDDDVDVSKLRALEGDELDFLDQGENAPQIAGIIDERPEDVRKLEDFKSTSKWKVINTDDGFNSKLQVQEIKRTVTDKQKDNELVFGKMYSDSEDEKNDSDLSPPRKQGQNKTDVKDAQKHIVSDPSQPRRQQHKEAERRNSNSSPKRKGNYDFDISPPRTMETDKPKNRGRKQSRWGDLADESRDESSNSRRKSSDSSRKDKIIDSDVSPPRKSRKITPERHRKEHRRERDDGHSSSRKAKNTSDLKLTLRRRTIPSRGGDRSPSSNLSPPKSKQTDTKRSRKNSSDSDLSPPRKNRDIKRERKSDSDLSPPRSRKRDARRTRKDSSDSDLSPPRKKNEIKREQNSDSDLSPPRKRSEYRRNSDSPPPTNKKMAKTLEGKTAGLQDASQLRRENEAFKRREAEVFNQMTDNVSGRNAKAVSRKTGKKETAEDRQKQIEKAERQKLIDEKYKKWGKGLKQVEDQERRVQEFIHEASKPLARHKDDADLEGTLKEQERDGDPMLAYIRDRKRECGDLPPERPMYKGSFPPNRYNLRPGYRWDGVDRSNGYEKKFFDSQSKKKALEEEAYKWSSADL